MKKILSGVLLLLLSGASFAQTVNDNFSWAFSPTGVSTTNTLNSPGFNFCQDSQISFSINSPNSTICHAANQVGVPAWTVAGAKGILIPANPGANTTTSIPLTFSFPEAVCNLRLHFSDLDILESITNMSTPYNSYTTDLGGVFNPLSTTAIESGAANSAGWIEWTGSMTSLTFNYNRPSAGFGLFIDSITFDCCTVPCKCDHHVQFEGTGNASSDGGTQGHVTINSNGIALRSICVNLPFYVSNAADACLKCDPRRQELFGTIISGSAINGVVPTLNDPHGLGYSRTLCWTFATPTVVNQAVLIDLQFPPTLELECCKNKVSYCLDVDLTNEDCTHCEYQLCTQFPKNEDPKEESGKDRTQAVKTYARNNDFAEQKTFELSPNPSSGNVTIQLLSENLIDGNVSVWNTDGKVIYQGTISRMKENIRLNDATPGMYTVVIESKGLVSSERLIIK